MGHPGFPTRALHWRHDQWHSLQLSEVLMLCLIGGIIKTMNSIIEGAADQNGRVKEVQSAASIDPFIHPVILKLSMVL